jgi:hypothetical protein
MNRFLQEPDLYTVRGDGGTHVVLSYTAETAEALGIREEPRGDGTVHVSYRLAEPAPRPRGASRANAGSRN